MNAESHPVKEYTNDQCQQAAEWFLIIHDARDPGIEVLQEWNRWLSASEGNRLAFKAVAEVYHITVPSLAAPLVRETTARLATRKHSREDYDGQIPVAEWLARSAQPAVPERSAAAIWKRWLPPLAAAAVLAAIAVSWSLFESAGPLVVPPVGTVETRTAEHREIVLPDGSRVTLGARSRLSIGFDDAARSVRLDRGEAFFVVRKDPHRPFVVRALNGVITAVGTAFNVRATEDRITVAVTEGSVRIAANTTPAVAGNAAELSVESSGLRLASGEQVALSSRTNPSNATTAPITRFDTDEAVRWRTGWLIYRNEPLRYVIADVARYTDLQLEVSGAVADDLRFSGAVFKDDVSEWLMALPRVFPITVESSGTHMIIDSRASSVTVNREPTLNR